MAGIERLNYVCLCIQEIWAVVIRSLSGRGAFTVRFCLATEYEHPAISVKRVMLLQQDSSSSQYVSDCYI